MTRLSVNINKIATLRNARGENNPDLIEFAIKCEQWGAQGITVHPRPDERHIRYSDVPALRKVVTTEFNIEGYPSEDFIRLVVASHPEQVTLVPDKPGQITSNSGWDIDANFDFLLPIVKKFRSEGIRTSIFIPAEERQVEAAARVGADRVELYTKPYADEYFADREKAVEAYVRASAKAMEISIGVNAGHDLSLDNLRYLAQRLPKLDEVSIGHALICDALFIGMPEAIRRYRVQLED